MNLKRIPQAFFSRTHRYINQRRGWMTNRKIVVIESDDWGSIRMPSKEVYNKLLKAGIAVDRCIYNKYDSLASKDDMELLFDILSRYKDINNNSAIITANSVIANPDFEKIRRSGFDEYYFEPFTVTLKRKTNNSVDTWFDGMRNKVFHPQFHGREHLNINRWFNYLRNGSQELKTAFDYEVFGISTTISNENNPSFMAALAVDEKADYEEHRVILEEGYKVFEKVFGYKSDSFIAPNYTWHPFHEKVLSDLGVKYLQGAFNQNIPYPKQMIKKGYHYIGQINNNQQIYLVRNCLFEPSSNPQKDWVNHCLKDIENAFKNKKPAIICSHRVNFIGSIVPDNRDINLKLFERLLQKISREWLDVEFMTSDMLGNLIITES